MRLDLRFAVLLLAASACTTDDSGTGTNTVQIDTVPAPADGTDDAGKAAGPDAQANKPVVDGAVGHSNDASGPTADDGGALQDSSVTTDASEPVDASAPVDPTPGDASTPVVDAGSGLCGTRGGVQCKAGEFCDFGGDPLCGATDKGGVCKVASKICPQLYAPVCGCNGRSYGSECAAHGAGVSVQHAQLCTPDECTALGGKVKYSTGADIPKCGAGQEQWNLSGGIEPVICCLGKGAPDPTEPTPIDPGICGGIAGFKCDKGEFCNYEPPKGQGCDMIADGAGVCEPVPQACTQDYDPVCGCNGKTYSNACAAHSAGASVKTKGACL